MQFRGLEITATTWQNISTAIILDARQTTDDQWVVNYHSYAAVNDAVTELHSTMSCITSKTTHTTNFSCSLPIPLLKTYLSVSFGLVVWISARDLRENCFCRPIHNATVIRSNKQLWTLPTTHLRLHSNLLLIKHSAIVNISQVTETARYDE